MRKEPVQPPKEFCKRGHRLAEVGYCLNPSKNRRGEKVFGRRCRQCGIEDLNKSRAKRAEYG